MIIKNTQILSYDSLCFAENFFLDLTEEEKLYVLTLKDNDFFRTEKNSAFVLGLYSLIGNFDLEEYKKNKSEINSILTKIDSYRYEEEFKMKIFDLFTHISILNTEIENKEKENSSNILLNSLLSKNIVNF